MRSEPLMNRSIQIAILYVRWQAGLAYASILPYALATLIPAFEMLFVRGNGR